MQYDTAEGTIRTTFRFCSWIITAYKHAIYVTYMFSFNFLPEKYKSCFLLPAQFISNLSFFYIFISFLQASIPFIEHSAWHLYYVTQAGVNKLIKIEDSTLGYRGGSLAPSLNSTSETVRLVMPNTCFKLTCVQHQQTREKHRGKLSTPYFELRS